MTKLGITAPTAIQSEAIPALLQGANACLEAETGTGKTLAYLLPIFTRLDLTQAATQAIVLAPTHELALQIHRQCTDLSQHAALPVRSLLLISGTALNRQVEKLKTRPHVVVGSPGRIRDLIHTAKLRTSKVRTLVLDEADRLLSGDSDTDVRIIRKSLPAGCQMVFASATQQEASARTMAEIAPDVALFQPVAGAVNADITHLYLVCERRDKLKLLRRVLSATQTNRALVFAEANDLAERAVAQLDHHHVAVAELHPDFDKRDRKQAMDDFRSGRVRVLVASDMAARGLDLPDVTHVINLDAPLQPRAYLHRAGRTGRAGRHGETITLLTEDQLRLVRRYESELGIRLQRVRLREGRLEAVGETSTGWGGGRALRRSRVADSAARSPTARAPFAGRSGAGRASAQQLFRRHSQPRSRRLQRRRSPHQAGYRGRGQTCRTGHALRSIQPLRPRPRRPRAQRMPGAGCWSGFPD